MKALVLEKKKDLGIRDIEIDESLGEDDVEVAVKNVGICGSDLHFYNHGYIGPYVMKEPMILGHEASGIVERTGKHVTHLKPGDRVCMEPGIPNPNSRISREGKYNLDPDVVFWATPPVHGVTRERVIHPASYTYKLPETVSFAEGALVEPLAIGMQSVKKARIQTGDTAVVIGAGTIGLMVAAAALTQGCRQIIVADVVQEKLNNAETLDSRIVPVNPQSRDIGSCVSDLTGGRGAEIVFEASGSSKVTDYIFNILAPGGCLVYVGMPVEPICFDILKAQAKEITIETVFRYANVYHRAIDAIASGTMQVKQFVTDVFPFAKGVEAYEYANSPGPETVKVQIELD